MSDWGFLFSFSDKEKKVSNLPVKFCARMEQPFLQTKRCVFKTDDSIPMKIPVLLSTDIIRTHLKLTCSAGI